MSHIKPLFKCGPRNREEVDWVVEVTPTVFSALINKRTFIGLISTFPRPYISAPYCRRCLALDHATKVCKKDITYHHCAETWHERSNCQNKKKPPTCLHCGEQHPTMAKECKTWAQRLRAVQRLTDYGSQNQDPSNVQQS